MTACTGLLALINGTVMGIGAYKRIFGSVGVFGEVLKWTPPPQRSHIYGQEEVTVTLYLDSSAGRLYSETQVLLLLDEGFEEEEEEEVPAGAGEGTGST